MELQSRFAFLLQPIRDLTKNWDVDVAAQLEDYLTEVRAGRGGGGGSWRRELSIIRAGDGNVLIQRLQWSSLHWQMCCCVTECTSA